MWIISRLWPVSLVKCQIEPGVKLIMWIKGMHEFREQDFEYQGRPLFNWSSVNWFDWGLSASEGTGQFHHLFMSTSSPFRPYSFWCAPYFESCGQTCLIGQHFNINQRHTELHNKSYKNSPFHIVMIKWWVPSTPTRPVWKIPISSLLQNSI